MQGENPHIKVTWSDTPEEFTPERVKRIKEYFKKKYNTRDVKILTKIVSEKSDTKLKSLEVSDSILDPNYQKTLMNDFIKTNGIHIKHDLIDRLDNRVNEIIFQSEESRVKYNRWYIKNIEFSNFLSFGQNNKIDFENLDGITVVESNPRNFGGKSTATVDLLLFLFFNTTTKTKTSIEVFNRFTDNDEVKVKGTITIDGDDYIIERIVTRKQTRSGDYNARTDLQISKYLPDGSVENLNGEQRRETEQFIIKAIGTQEDFLSTILTTGYNLEELIDDKPTARGQKLTKFLGLDALKEKEKVCKELELDYKRKMVSNTYDKVTLETKNEQFQEVITQSEKGIDEKTKFLSEVTDKLEKLNDAKDKLLSEKYSDIDKDLVNTNPQTIKREISDISDKIKKNEDVFNATVVVEPKEYYLEDEHEEIKLAILNLGFDVKTHNTEIKSIETFIKQLKEGSICPQCKRPLDEVDHTNDIKLKEEEILVIKKKIEDIEKVITEKEKVELKFSGLKKELEVYERAKVIKSKYEFDLQQLKVELDGKNVKLNYYELNKQRHERNIEIDKELVGYKTHIETANSDIRQSNIKIEQYKNEIKNSKEKIDTNKELIKKIQQEEEVLQTFKVYNMVFGKNGISKTIMKEMIPLLNMELGHLLDDSCFFKLEININDKNELDFVMIDTETRVVKPLNAGSGYERTIASLALRSVLTKVSSLPKPNIVVMDEVFGKIADENIEMVGEFFIKIKDFFEHIFVISHNPLIRTWSDNLLMVEKEENISKIDFISTKI